MSKVIPPAKPYFLLGDIEEIKGYVEKILASGMLTLHTYTREFEEKFAKLCGVRNAVAVNSGTAALEIALRCMELNAGDEVLVPTNTFSATAATVFFAGAKPTLTDMDPKTLCIDADNIQKYMTNNTKGVIVVHIGGLVCPDMKAVSEVCEDHKLFLVEDAAHAHGSMIYGKPAGSLGDAGCFSFYPTKVMTTGEGGVVTTDDDKMTEKARVLRDQGKENLASNMIVELGYNWRMDEISAAIGLVQLRRLPQIIKRRNKIAKCYDQALSKMSSIEPLKNPPNILHNYYKYVALLDHGIDREKLKESLRTHGVRFGGEVYWPPLHMQPIYQKLLGTRKGDFPMAEDVCSRMVALPMYTQMTIEEAEYVVQTIKEVLSEF